jgi:hypothetical protein
MKMPNFEIQLEMCDFIMKNLVQSRCAKDRQMFMELAALAVEDFSCDYFKSFFGEFIFFFAQEKNIQVMHTFAKYVVKFREGLALGGGLS